MEWILKHRDEHRRKRLATHQNTQSQPNAEQAHFKSAVASAPKKFFSIRRKRNAKVGLTQYNLLEQTGEEPGYSNQATEEAVGNGLQRSFQSMEPGDGEEIPCNPFATPQPSPEIRPIDSVSNAGWSPRQSPEADDATSQTWLERVSSTIRRRPTIKALEAYKSGGIRSAWACTLPRNWKSRNAVAVTKAMVDSAAELDNSQLHRSMDDMDLDDERRRPLPNHWRDGVDSRQAFVNRTGGVAGCHSEVGDWNSPSGSEDGDLQGDRVMELHEEFRDWIDFNKVLIEQYDPLAEASKRMSILSKLSRRGRYSDYFREV